MSTSNTPTFVMNGKQYPLGDDGKRFTDPASAKGKSSPYHMPQRPKRSASAAKSWRTKVSEFLLKLGVILEASALSGPPAAIHNNGFTPFGHHTR